MGAGHCRRRHTRRGRSHDPPPRHLLPVPLRVRGHRRAGVLLGVLPRAAGAAGDVIQRCFASALRALARPPVRNVALMVSPSAAAPAASSMRSTAVRRTGVGGSRATDGSYLRVCWLGTRLPHTQAGGHVVPVALSGVMVGEKFLDASLAEPGHGVVSVGRRHENRVNAVGLRRRETMVAVQDDPIAAAVVLKFGRHQDIVVLSDLLGGDDCLVAVILAADDHRLHTQTVIRAVLPRNPQTHVTVERFTVRQ